MLAFLLLFLLITLLFGVVALLSHNELFDSEKEAIEFYSKPENYKSLILGDIGENLIAKYTAISLLALDDIFTVIFYVIRNKLKK